jgi:N-acetylmuramoyl-L-alanine amidase
LKGVIQRMVKIYLDAGHGGKDPGAIGNGLQEKDVVLDISKRIEQKLQAYKNVEIMQTRTDDIFLSLDERTIKANTWGADCFLSIHINSNTNITARGFETYIYNGSISPATVAYQNVIHEEALKKIGKMISSDRGKKKANFAVLRESNMKACLSENLFISNSSDANLLKQDSFLDMLSQGYVNGLEKFFGLERTIRPPTDNDSPVTNGELFQVIAGTYANYDNAEVQVKKLISDGYNAYINKKD